MICTQKIKAHVIAGACGMDMRQAKCILGSVNVKDGDHF